MGTWHLWHRLLWKEARESWPVLLLILALPLALFVLLCHPGTVYYSLMPPMEVGAALISILVSLWAVDRVHGKALVHRKARTQLPVPALTRWLATYLLPLLIPLLGGIALGVLCVEYRVWSSSLPHGINVTVQQDWKSAYQGAPGYLLATTLFMLANFVLCTTLATVLSAIPAIMAGVAWLFLGLDSAQPERGNPLFLCAIGGALLGSLAWELCARRQRYLPGRILSLLLLAGITTLPVLLVLLVSHSRQSTLPPNYNSGGFITTDFTTTLRPHYDERHHVILADMIEYNSLREHVTTKHQFEGNILPLLLVADQHEAYLAQQHPHESAIHLLAWDVHRNAVHEVMQFPAQRDALQLICGFATSAGYGNAAASPDGRYLLFVTVSDSAHGRDIWVLDLPHQRAGMVLANVNPNPFDANWLNQEIECAWSAGCALLTVGNEMVQVDPAAMRAKYLDIPAPAAPERSIR